MNKPISQTLRTLTVLVLAMSASVGLRAQTGVEYFFDADPGRGQARQASATIDADGNLQFSAPTDGLTPGDHLLGLRAYRQVAVGGDVATHYGPTIVQQIYVPRPAGDMAIGRVEYFWDSDPGAGLATTIATTPGLELNLDNIAIPTTGLAPGTHLLGVRAYGNSGWGPTLMQEVYVPRQAGSMAISRVEYFWDSDPGAGQGTPVSVTPGQEVTLDNVAVSTDGLTSGVHRLFIRAYGDSGWGPTVASDVYVQPATGMTITRGEYFWNEDPGFGQGTPISLTPGEELTIDDLKVPSYMAHGDATLFVRFQGAQGWSPTYGYTVMVDAEGNYTLNAQAETSMEGRNFQSLYDMADDFTDRGIGGDVTLTVKTKNTDYALDLTDADRLAQVTQMAQNLEERSTARDHVTIGFTAADASGNTLTVTARDEDLPAVVGLMAQTSQENVVLTINGTGYNFTAATQRSEMVCSGEPSAVVALSGISTNVKATWTAQPRGGSLLSGFATSGEGDLPAMTIVNSGTRLDSLAYAVTLSDEDGRKLYEYLYYIYVPAKMTNQTFSGLLPEADASLSPGTATLKWNAMDDAVGGYKVNVSSRPTDDETAEPTTQSYSGLTATAQEIAVESGRTYTWTVTAVGYCDEVTSPAQTFSVRLLPDLVVTDVTPPEAAEAGNTISVKATVKNQGTGATIEGEWTDRLYYVIDGTDFANAVALGDAKHTGDVAAGDSYEVTFDVQVPYVEGSAIRFFVTADAAGKLLEANAGNNRTLSATSATLKPFYMNADDLAVLRQLHSDFNGQNWNGTRWDVASELITQNNWSGVSFDTDGRVTAINLQGRGLSGVLTTAQQPALPQLTTLNLSRNALTGDPAKFIAADKLPLLATVDLSYNQIDELSAPLPADVTVTLSYQHRTYNKSASLQGLSAMATTVLGLATQMEVTMPAIVRYVHGDQAFDAHPTIYVWKSDMATRYGQLTWSNTNDCYGFVSNSTYMLNCGQDEDVVLVPTSGAFANSAYAGRVHLTFGDANMTGLIDVNDVQSTLNYIISATKTKFNFWAANTWDDELINIQDIVCTVNLVLDNQGDASRAAARRAGGQTEGTAANQFYTSGRYVCLQAQDEVAAFDLELEGVTSSEVRLLLSQRDWQMQTRDTERGVRLLVFSPTGQTLPTGVVQLLRLSGVAQPVAAEATSLMAEPVSVGIGATTGINSIADDEADGALYDLQGRRVADERRQLPKGIYIKNGKKIRR